MVVLEKKIFEIGKVSKFAVECLSIDIVSQKSLFRPNYEVFFWQKIRKFGTLEKLGYVMKSVFS